MAWSYRYKNKFTKNLKDIRFRYPHYLQGIEQMISEIKLNPYELPYKSVKIKTMDFLRYRKGKFRIIVSINNELKEIIFEKVELREGVYLP